MCAGFLGFVSISCRAASTVPSRQYCQFSHRCINQRQRRYKQKHYSVPKSNSSFCLHASDTPTLSRLEKPPLHVSSNLKETSSQKAKSVALTDLLRPRFNSRNAVNYQVHSDSSNSSPRVVLTAQLPKGQFTFTGLSLGLILTADINTEVSPGQSAREQEESVKSCCSPLRFVEVLEANVSSCC